MLNLSSGTPRPNYIRRMLRQVSWLSGPHCLPAFPVNTSGKMGQKFADYSCGGSPGFRVGTNKTRHRIPY